MDAWTDQRMKFAMRWILLSFGAAVSFCRRWAAVSKKRCLQGQMWSVANRQGKRLMPHP